MCGMRCGIGCGACVMAQRARLVVEELLELESRPHDARLEGDRLLDEVRLDVVERRVADAGLALERREEVGLREVRVDVLGALAERALEEVARPLDRVRDLVGEVLQRAHRDRALGRVT